MFLFHIFYNNIINIFKFDSKELRKWEVAQWYPKRASNPLHPCKTSITVENELTENYITFIKIWLNFFVCIIVYIYYRFTIPIYIAWNNYKIMWSEIWSFCVWKIFVLCQSFKWFWLVPDPWLEGSPNNIYEKKYTLQNEK